MAACLLTDQPCTLRNLPSLMDIETMGRLLGVMGVTRAAASLEGEEPTGTLVIHAAELTSTEAPYDLVRTMRASVLVLGPLVARTGRARVSLPGGCAIGARPINLHLKGLEALGVDIELDEGYVNARAERLEGGDYTFDKVTVTGTENLVMAASLAEGRTVLRNCAREPEVVDLCRVLRSMGAVIEGDGTHTITIDGVERLSGFDHQIMPDRIEAGTWLAAAAATGSRLTLTRARPETMAAVIAKFKEAGADIEAGEDELTVDCTAGRLIAADCDTAPYPGFPTDMQAQFMAAMCLAEGASVITETIFENRFMHVPELARMGADIQVQGNRAVVKGVASLSGAPVMATDLRASASLIVAGLAAQGQTVIRRVYHLDRGYERIARKLSAVGADIRREPE